MTIKSRTVRVGRLPIHVASSELENGVRVYSARNASAYGVSLAVANCLNRETKKLNGIRHFLEHMVLKSPHDSRGRSFAERIEYAGGRWEGFSEADIIYFTLEAPSWKLAERLLPEYRTLAHPQFTQEQVAAERGVVLSEIRLEHGEILPYAMDRVEELLFPRRPIALPIHGTEEGLQHFTAAQLLEFHRQKYTSGRLMIVGGGRLHHKDLHRASERLLGSLPGKPCRFAFPIEPVYAVGRKEYREVRQSSRISHLVVAFNISPILLEKNRQDLPAVSVLISILGGEGGASRLYRKFRKQMGIGYTTEIALLRQSESHAIALFATETHSATTMDDLEKIILEEITRAQNERTPSYERLGHIMQLRKGIRDKADRAPDIMEELMYSVVRSSWKNMFSAYAQLSKVSAADIQRVARTYFDLGNYAVVRIEGCA